MPVLVLSSWQVLYPGTVNTILQVATVLLGHHYTIHCSTSEWVCTVQVRTILYDVPTWDVNWSAGSDSNKAHLQWVEAFLVYNLDEWVTPSESRQRFWVTLVLSGLRITLNEICNRECFYCQLSNISYFQRGSRKFLGLYNQSTRLGRIHFHPLARHYIFLLLHTILQFTLSRCTNPCLTCFRILNMIECSETESTILCVSCKVLLLARYSTGTYL